MGREFRVRWRREEKAHDVTQIFQTHAGALGKIDRLLALEEVKADLTSYHGMPDLVGPPVLEFREVGDWTPHPEQPDGASGEARSEWRATVHKEQEARDGRRGPILHEPIAEEDIPF